MRRLGLSGLVFLSSIAVASLAHADADSDDFRAYLQRQKAMELQVRKALDQLEPTLDSLYSRIDSIPAGAVKDSLDAQMYRDLSEIGTSLYHDEQADRQSRLSFFIANRHVEFSLHPYSELEDTLSSRWFATTPQNDREKAAWEWDQAKQRRLQEGNQGQVSNYVLVARFTENGWPSEHGVFYAIGSKEGNKIVFSKLDGVESTTVCDDSPYDNTRWDDGWSQTRYPHEFYSDAIRYAAAKLIPVHDKKK